MIELKPVDSTTINKVGYDAESTTLRVMFHSGSTYQYTGVPKDLFESLMSAKSIGKFFGAGIKDQFTTFKEQPDGSLVQIYPKPGEEQAAAAPAPEVDTTLPAADVPPEVAAETIKVEAIERRNEVVSLVVSNAEGYKSAAAMLIDIQTKRKAREAWFAPKKAAAYQTHKLLCDAEKEAIAPLLEAERILGGKMTQYERDEARARAAEEERIAKERKAQADAEAKRKADELALADAEKAELEGKPELAQAILENPAPVAPEKPAPVVLPREVPKVEGMVGRAPWRFRIVDASKIPSEYLMPDEVKIGGVVRAMKGMTNIPGVEAYQGDKTYGTRSK